MLIAKRAPTLFSAIRRAPAPPAPWAGKQAWPGGPPAPISGGHRCVVGYSAVHRSSTSFPRWRPARRRCQTPS
eukprot:5988284-Pyramimonas_sp.AAC.1